MHQLRVKFPFSQFTLYCLFSAKIPTCRNLTFMFMFGVVTEILWSVLIVCHPYVYVCIYFVFLVCMNCKLLSSLY